MFLFNPIITKIVLSKIIILLRVVGKINQKIRLLIIQAYLSMSRKVIMLAKKDIIDSFLFTFIINIKICIFFSLVGITSSDFSMFFSWTSLFPLPFSHLLMLSISSTCPLLFQCLIVFFYYLFFWRQNERNFHVILQHFIY